MTILIVLAVAAAIGVFAYHAHRRIMRWKVAWNGIQSRGNCKGTLFEVC